MFILTSAILKKIALNMPLALSVNASNIFNKVCPLYQIDSADIFHEFLANVLVESNELTKLVESLYYRPERLLEVWPSRFKTIKDAEPFARNPEKLAAKVYNGRNGNVQLKDGWNFRGSGPMGITGRENTTLFTVFYNKKFGTKYTIEQMAELLRSDLEIGIHSACWIFAISKKLIDLAISDNMKEIVRRINGGYIGIKERLEYYERAKKYVIDFKEQKP